MFLVGLPEAANARAVLDQRRVDMTYESRTRVASRAVDPLGLVLKAGARYLVGRSGPKSLTFRVSAIRERAVRDEAFERPADFDLPPWWQAFLARFESGLRPGRATLRLTAEGRRRLAELGRYAVEAVDAACMAARHRERSSGRRGGN